MPSPTPLSRLAGAHARRATRRRRTVLAVVALAAVTGLGALLATCVGGSSPPPRASPAPSAHSTSTNAHGGRSEAISAAESGLLPWTLAAPISRSVVLPGPGAQLVILGGLTTSNVSTQGIYTLDTTSGRLVHVANLTAGLHDASGAVIDGRDVTFGGGSPATVATVQGVPAPGSTLAGTVATATATGSLPQPRSDSTAVTVGETTYVVGGYDGSNPDPAVLATTDGRTFSTVASLPVPVRYPAVAASGGLVYVFGGDAITGAGAGEPVNTIQVVNPSRHTASTIGRLPVPLDGAVAVTIGTQIYLAGGESTVAQAVTAGLGTTQLGPPPPGAHPGAGATSATATAAIAPGTGSAGAGVTGGTLLDASRGTSTSGSGTGSGSARDESTPATSAVSTIWAFDPATDRVLSAGRLQVPVAHSSVAVLGTTAWLVGGESDGTPVSTVQMLIPNSKFGSAGKAGAGSPYFGMQLLIADRGNNRFLLLNPAMDTTWTYPSATTPSDPYGFVFPDDAFFIDKGRAIISNQEQNETIVDIAYPSGKILWEYGHPKQPGTAPGYLHEPDDAYLLANGQVTVADADELPHRDHQPRRHRGRADRQRRSLRAQSTCIDGIAQWRHAARRWQPPHLRDQRLVDQRVHIAGALGVDGTRPGVLSVGPPAARTRPLSRRRLRKARSVHLHQPRRPGALPVRGRLGPRHARPSVARRASSERSGHAQRRLRQPDGRHRSHHRRARLAVRNHRRGRHSTGDVEHTGRI